MTEPVSSVPDRWARLAETLDKRSWQGSTHWEDCYLDPRHRDCALRMLLEARAADAAAHAEAIQRLTAERDTSHKHEADAWLQVEEQRTRAEHAERQVADLTQRITALAQERAAR